jgi:hypothetical protein
LGDSVLGSAGSAFVFLLARSIFVSMRHPTKHNGVASPLRCLSSHTLCLSVAMTILAPSCIIPILPFSHPHIFTSSHPRVLSFLSRTVTSSPVPAYLPLVAPRSPPRTLEVAPGPRRSRAHRPRRTAAKGHCGPPWLATRRRGAELRRDGNGDGNGDGSSSRFERGCLVDWNLAKRSALRCAAPRRFHQCATQPQKHVDTPRLHFVIVHGTPQDRAVKHADHLLNTYASHH